MQAMRVRALRRLPIAFGWMAKHPLPDELLDRWLEPLQRQRAVRRDFRKYVTSGRRRQMVEVCERLRAFERPALVVWTPEDKVQRPEHGRRFAQLLPGRAPGGDRRQLHADHARPAAGVRAGDPRVRARAGADRRRRLAPTARGGRPRALRAVARACEDGADGPHRRRPPGDRLAVQLRGAARCRGRDSGDRLRQGRSARCCWPG